MTTAKRSIDGIVASPMRQPKLAPLPAARPEPLVTHVPGTKPLPHLAPYVPKVQHPPVTFLRPSHGEPRPPVVVDGTVRPVVGLGPKRADITAIHKPVAQISALPPKQVFTKPAVSQPFPIHSPQADIGPAELPAIELAPPNTATPNSTHTSTQRVDTAPSQQPAMQPVKKRGKLWRILDLLQYPVLAVIALLAAQSTAVGQWFVLAYAVYAFIRRVPSQASFGMALFLLVSIPVFQLLHQPGIAQNTAVYVYELLVVGTVQAIIELYITRHNKVPRT